jgi:hypothetical protein
MLARIYSPKLTRILIFAVLCSISFAYIIYYPLSTNLGSAMYLQAGQMLLEGQMPYVDFVDINPPLIIYVSAIFAGLAWLVKIHIITTFLLSVWFLSIVSILVTRKILQANFGEADNIAANILAIALATISIWLLISDNSEFGQREHLFMLAFYPYLAVRLSRWENLDCCSAGLAFAVGLIAGIAACLKPHFLALVVAPELFWVLKNRRLRSLLAPETIALSSAGLLYAGHFLVLPREMRVAYFDRWLPMIAEGYRAWDKPLAYFSSFEVLWVGLPLCLGILLFKSNLQSMVWKFTQILCVVFLVAAALLIGQGKGFSYHAVPAQYALVGVIALLLAEAMRGIRVPVSYAGLNIALIVILIAATVVCGVFLPRAFSNAPLAAIVRSSAIAREIYRHTSSADRVVFFSTSPVHAYPVLTELDRRPGSRLLWFFPVSMIYRDVRGFSGNFPYRSPQEQPIEERRLLSELAEDIAKNQPRLVFIHDGCAEGCPRGFNLHDYLTQVGFIDSALREYSQTKRVKNMLVYRRSKLP